MVFASYVFNVYEPNTVLRNLLVELLGPAGSSNNYLDLLLTAAEFVIDNSAEASTQPLYQILYEYGVDKDDGSFIVTFLLMWFNNSFKLIPNLRSGNRLYDVKYHPPLWIIVEDIGDISEMERHYGQYDYYDPFRDIEIDQITAAENFDYIPEKMRLKSYG